MPYDYCYAMRLNNYMTKRHQEHLLTMSAAEVGGLWRVEYKFNGELKGSGTGQKKQAAQEAAALQALQSFGVEV